MTRKQLLKEFLEASNIDKDDIAYYGRFTSYSNGDKTYTGIEGLYVELKTPSNPFGMVAQLTYFHHPKLER